MLQPALSPAPKLYTPLYADPVQAGFPSPAQGYEQQAIDLNELMVSNPPATFFVRAKGDSMVDAGIREGDLLVVDFSRQPKHGDIVIARLDDGFTVKRLYQRRQAVRLCAENKAAAVPAYRAAGRSDAGSVGRSAFCRTQLLMRYEYARLCSRGWQFVLRQLREGFSTRFVRQTRGCTLEQ
jgi:DNA polymerase V